MRTVDLPPAHDLATHPEARLTDLE